ncbi:hypothetical protein M902_1564 [Bacteriovorax sp. BAL6_X]|uniref:hypothetical protein n=1 Tax=Bacteriovorax sp. BAL6_X TaxID=1201290 RepID=UPI000386D0B2|nr:hypothetical protein [Bacteriovorax sp. BAL6_X]EPZ50444.1 hypothetical protein M902_1564 [Bacteriovorax sp. BAL6_X]
MKATAIYKKFIIASVLSGSFLVFGGIYQGISVTDNSFMQQKDISFEKRVDESVDRIVASSDRDKVSVQYLPVAEYSQIIDGQWEIVRVENHEGNEIFNEKNVNSKRLVDMKLIGTGLVQLNDSEEYTFDVSFLHENNKNISIFRAYEDGFELIEARKVIEEKIEETLEVNIDKELEEVAVIDENERRELVIERVVLPQLNNKLIRGEDKIEGSVTVGPNGIQGLYFNVFDKDINEVLGDIKLKDGSSFEVELQGQLSHGVFARNGENGYRLRFTTGPYAGGLINYVTYDELERVNAEFENMERAKEESRFERSLTEEGSFENDINLAQSNANPVSFEKQNEEQAEEERYEERYEDEQYEEEALIDDPAARFEEQQELEYERQEELDRQGYGF